jgi:23S rRNA maturation mini-RNase III
VETFLGKTSERNTHEIIPAENNKEKAIKSVRQESGHNAFPQSVKSRKIAKILQQAQRSQNRNWVLKLTEFFELYKRGLNTKEVNEMKSAKKLIYQCYQF